MPTYDISFIIELSKSIQHYELNNDIENFLNNILLDIKKPFYNISPNFNSNYYTKNSKSRNIKYSKELNNINRI